MRARTFGLAALLLASCTAVSRDPGTDAWLQIPGAEFVPGAPPEGHAQTTVASVVNDHGQITIGSVGEHVRGALSRGARAVILAVPGDAGYWLVPAGIPDVETPDLPSFDLRLGFAADLPPGDVEIDLYATDRAGELGPKRPLALVAAAPATPAGALVVTLAWDRDADLDLHVVDPAGVEIWRGNPNSYQPPPPGHPPDDPSAWMKGARLDVDANVGCKHGGRLEHVAWPIDATPPPGTYTVRVDTFAMCGEGVAFWTVDATAAARTLGHAVGESHDSDTFFDHGPGAGALAMTFEVP